MDTVCFNICLLGCVWIQVCGWGVDRVARGVDGASE